MEAANEVINHNARQIQKKIWTDKTEGNKIKVIKTMTETEEGKRVADTIIEQKSRHNLHNPRRGIGESTIEQISKLADDNDMSMWEVLTKIEFNNRSRKSIGDFVQLIHAFKAKAVKSQCI
ncbi:MAG: hypothetical protein IPO98_13370 [Saprospiraceae bacterium]|nr:hypothetical protein [Saprospiraceae bacterium]